MDGKRNNSSWCCDQIEEKIKEYKIVFQHSTNEDVRKCLEAIIKDLENILYC